MTFTTKWSAIPAIASVLALTALFGAPAGHADSMPVGPLPRGPVVTTTTKLGLLVAVALPIARPSSSLVWRLARQYDPTVVRQVSEANVGAAVVLVFKVTGRGDTALVFALTGGDSSAKAIRSSTHRIHSI
jgi:hypothetical protein